MKIVAVSGGFDPVHIGHINLLREARALGDKLVVILNNDHWLAAKKGFVFMPERERKAILETVKYVDEVIISSHPKQPADMSVCAELEKLKPDVFANGGDRKPDEDPIPEVALCDRLGIQVIYNVGGGKTQSSSELVKRVKLKTS
ncbi:MAG: hypothetical protein A2846_01925 [Candidatus Doudnabacteria bacterium RIFCSPHIGHO2_01_FULL_49_9]|uniref:Cytidyltransferase-like domain-containing protein n=1 Tax=Candidatus Doudnabacteria bacterium RIFCSPHIGHO2_01_FULL_49_9 TaxID=1817827 RepID=A0A1F5P3E8_9BACT|nr:MAG: hypothetical protein A2846_01925 [Candidatus Doudnabacteria bacterium RIFCSPHIGHO2_01_FULL_49_9]